MARHAARIILTPKERTTLQSTVRSPKAAQRDVMRARVVLLAAAGNLNDAIQRELRVSKPVVVKWRRRFALRRLAGLSDLPGRGRQRKYDAEVRRRVAATACAPPPQALGAGWTMRTLADYLGVSVWAVRDVLSAEGIKTSGMRYWKASAYPEFEPKRLNIIALHVHPSGNAVVISADETTSVQESRRSLAGRPDRRRRGPKHGRDETLSLLRALEVRREEASQERLARSNGGALLKFLQRVRRSYADNELHLIVDSEVSHFSNDLQAWIAKQQRIHLHFAPTHSAWLNQIGIWFRILTKRIEHHAELVTKLLALIDAHSKQGYPTEWIYSGDRFGPMRSAK